MAVNRTLYRDTDKYTTKSITVSKISCSLGVLSDEHLQWNDQIAHVKINLNHAIGILSKIRYNANPAILEVVYHSLFGSNLLYGPQLWGKPT